MVTYALCNYKCMESKKCLRYINRNSKEKAVIDFKQICGAKHQYQWLYEDRTQIQKSKEKRTQK